MFHKLKYGSHAEKKYIHNLNKNQSIQLFITSDSNWTTGKMKEQIGLGKKTYFSMQGKSLDNCTWHMMFGYIICEKPLAMQGAHSIPS